MNYKRVIGIIVVIVGILLIFLSMFIKSRVSSELSDVRTKTEFVENNPYTKDQNKMFQDTTKEGGKVVNKMAEDRASSYVTAASWLLFSGIVVTIIGGCIFVFGGSRPRSKD